MRQRRIRGHRGIAENRPIEDREKGQVIALDINADGGRRIDRGAVADDIAEARQALQTYVIRGAVAGDDIGQAGLEGVLQGEIIRRLSIGIGNLRCQDQQQKCRCRAAPQAQAVDATAEEQGGETIKQKQHGGSGKNKRCERGGGLRCQRADGDLSRQRGYGVQFVTAAGDVEGAFLGATAIKAGRSRGRGRGLVDGGGGDGLHIGRGVGQFAETIEPAPWREGLRIGLGRGNGSAAARRRCQIKHAAQHADEEAGQWQVRPIGIGGDMEQHDQALALVPGGHQWRAVVE